MNSITITKKLKWRFKDFPHIQVSSDGLIFNIKTGRGKKICVVGTSVGIWLNGKFILKSKLNDYIEPIPKFEYKHDNFLNEF